MIQKPDSPLAGIFAYDPTIHHRAKYIPALRDYWRSGTGATDMADAKVTEFPKKGETDARLRSFIERVERLESEKAELAEDIKEIYGEAKVNGYDPKIMRKIVRMRKMDVEKRREEEALIEVYRLAVGMD